MKQLLYVLFLFISLACFAQRESDLPNPQKPPKLVNDFTRDGLLTASEIQALENKLVAYDDSTSNQVAVILVDNLMGFSPADYAITIGRKWGVGGKEYNNGVVLLISTGKEDGQRKVFIAPGYGLEGVVTDLLTSEIVSNELIPNLKAGNHYQAIDEATSAIIRAAEGRYTAPKDYHKRGEGISVLKVFLLFLIIIILISIFSNGGSSGGYMSRRGYRGWIDGPPIIGGRNSWPGGGGGWSGGGGGGFGGFGGGSFGGGGSGGSW